MNLGKLNEELDKLLIKKSNDKLRYEGNINEEYDLVGIDGNAFNIIGYVIKAMKEQGFSNDEIARYKEEATASNYDHLLSVSMQKIDACNSRLNSNEESNKEKEVTNNEKEITNTNLGPQSGNFTVTFGPGTYYIGDICYCLNDDEYDKIWGNKYKYSNGAYGFFAVGGTAYGDGEYYGGRWVFPVDAGVIGVVDMSHSKESADTLANDNYGCILNISNYLTFEYDKSGIFNFEYDGHSFTIDTDTQEEEDEEDEWEEDEW